jgi:hypothetical protein
MATIVKTAAISPEDARLDLHARRLLIIVQNRQERNPRLPALYRANAFGLV